MRTTDGAVGTVTLDAKTSVVLASRGQATALSVLVDSLGDPVDARIVADSHVVRIDQDDLEVLVGGILVDPVGVQHTEVGSDAANTLLGNRAKVADELELVDTVVLGLAIDNTLEVRSLAATTADSNSVHDVALLGLVAQAVSLVSTSGTSHALDLVSLAVLPSSARNKNRQQAQGVSDCTRKSRPCAVDLPNTKQKAKSIALLLSPQLLKILVSSHFILGPGLPQEVLWGIKRSKGLQSIDQQMSIIHHPRGQQTQTKGVEV